MCLLANMRYRAWVRVAMLSILLGSLTASSTQSQTFAQVKSRPRVGAAVLLPATAPPGKPGASLRGDCSSEGDLATRTDLVFCEPWELATWWQAGYQADGTRSIDRVADTNAVSRTSLVS